MNGSFEAEHKLNLNEIDKKFPFKFKIGLRSEDMNYNVRSMNYDTLIVSIGACTTSPVSFYRNCTRQLLGTCAENIGVVLLR